MSALLAVLLPLAAFLMLGIATERHHRARLGRAPTARAARRLRHGAHVLLWLAAAASVVAWGWVFGPVAWAGLVMAGAAASFLLLNLVPSRRAGHRP